MINEICSIYEEFYPYFSVPQTDECYSLNDFDQATNSINEGSRPFNVFDLELSEQQKASLNSFNIYIDPSWSKNDIFSHVEGEYSFSFYYGLDQSNNISTQACYNGCQNNTTLEEEIEGFLKGLSPRNSPELIGEVTNITLGVISKILPNFIDNYIGKERGVFVDLQAMPDNWISIASRWHFDFTERDFYFLATMFGSSTVYFIPSPEIYQELYGANRTSAISSLEAQGEPLNSLLKIYEKEHRLGLTTKFSVPQGYATIHSPKALHRAPEVGAARLLLGIAG